MEIGRHKDSGSRLEAILDELLLLCLIKVVHVDRIQRGVNLVICTYSHLIRALLKDA